MPTIKFNYKGPRCFGIQGYRSATEESLRSTAIYDSVHVGLYM